MERDLQVGTVLGGGTLEALSADSWMSLEFRDGSAVTVSGPTTLTIAENGQKQLHLREGSLFAKVARQSNGRPMLIRTQDGGVGGPRHPARRRGGSGVDPPERQRGAGSGSRGWWTGAWPRSWRITRSSPRPTGPWP